MQTVSGKATGRAAVAFPLGPPQTRCPPEQDWAQTLQVGDYLVCGSQQEVPVESRPLLRQAGRRRKCVCVQEEKYLFYNHQFTSLRGYLTLNI